MARSVGGNFLGIVSWVLCGVIQLGLPVGATVAHAGEVGDRVGQALLNARREIESGRTDQALNSLRDTQSWLREQPGIDPKDRREGDLRLQAEMMKAVREEERRAEEFQRANQRRDRQELRDQAVERLAPEQSAMAHLDRLFFQLGGPGGGGAAGGAGGFGGGVAGGGGAVGFGPGIGVVPEGITMQAFAVVTADRRYVRLSVRPFFVGPVEFFSIPVFGAVSGGGGFGGGSAGGGGGFGGGIGGP